MGGPLLARDKVRLVLRVRAGAISQGGLGGISGAAAPAGRLFHSDRYYVVCGRDKGEGAAAKGR